MQHDEIFFSKLKNEAEQSFSESKDYIQKQFDGLEKTGQRLTNDVSSGISSLENDITQSNTTKNSNNMKTTQLQMSNL